MDKDLSERRASTDPLLATCAWMRAIADGRFSFDDAGGFRS
jgi:hypothetical protein